MWTIARNRKLDEWDKIAFLASYALNSGGFKKWIRVENPFRVEYQRIALEDVDVPGLITERKNDESNVLSKS